MRDTVRALIPLFASFALLVVGHGLLGTLVGVRMSIAHFSMQAAGAVSACYSIGFVIGTRMDGRAIRNVLHIRTFAALCAIAASCVLAFVLFVQPVLWAILRLLYGACVAGLYMVMESWLNANSGPQLRGRILGLYSMITYIGFGGGQFLLMVAPPESSRLFLLVAMLLALSLVPIALARINQPEVVDIRPLAVSRLYRLQSSGLAGSLGAGVIIGSFLGMGPVFAKVSGFSDFEVSLFMGLTISGGFVLQWPIGMVSDRWDRRHVMAAVSVGIAVLSLAIGMMSSDNATPLIALATLWGALAFTLYPLSVALVNDHIEATEFVPASATLLFLYSLGMIVGNLGAGQLMAMAGRSGLFWISVIAAAALAGFTALASGARSAASEPDSEPQPYQALPRNSPYASMMDPRSEGVPGVQLELDLHGDEEGSAAATAEPVPCVVRSP